jgi:hypothetical protein
VRGNVVAYLALFVALGGVAYAGLKPLLDKKDSVNSANIKDGTVSRKDLGNGSVGNGEVTAKLKRQLGLSATAPQDGTYVGTGKDEESGHDVTVTSTWQDGVPTDAVMTSNDATCNSPDATDVTQESATSWTVSKEVPPDSGFGIATFLQGLNSNQVAVLFAANNPQAGGQCRVAGLVLQPQQSK